MAASEPSLNSFYIWTHRNEQPLYQPVHDPPLVRNRLGHFNRLLDDLALALTHHSTHKPPCLLGREIAPYENHLHSALLADGMGEPLPAAGIMSRFISGCPNVAVGDARMISHLQGR